MVHCVEIRRAVTWLATESAWARSKRSTPCSGKLCGGIIIFGQCCPRRFHFFQFQFLQYN